MGLEILVDIGVYSHLAGDLCLIGQCIRLIPKAVTRSKSSIGRDYLKPIFFYGYIPFQVIAVGSLVAYHIAK